MIWNLICGVLIAIISSVLTVHLALKRFYSEKWWERKFKVYEDIMVDLHHIRDEAAHQLTSWEKSMEIPEEVEKELKGKMLGAMAELRKHIDIGSFIISEKAVLILRIFEDEINKPTKLLSIEDFFKHVRLKLDAVDKCLGGMRIIAKKDLSLSRWFMM